MLEDGLILYHGSYLEIGDIDLALCDEERDFGRGFYLTTSKKQAVSFIRTSLAKAKRHGRAPEVQNFGFVTAYKVKLDKGVACFEFEGASRDWLYYVAINRRDFLSSKLTQLLNGSLEEYEVLIGKIANDDTNTTLTAYLAGAYGEIDEESTFNIVKSLLKPDRLESQFCFKSERAIKMLEKIGAEKYEL